MSKAVRLAASDLDAVEAVLEDGAMARTAVRLDSGGGLSSGVWESEAFTWETDGYPVDETCVIIEGVVEFRYADGSVETYGPGEAFSIKKGTPLVRDPRELAPRTGLPLRRR
jgi:uncharacterized cupin superfamily protein